MTPLHLAVKRNHLNIVGILLSEKHEQQSDPNLVNRNGQTPLHMAASAGYHEIIQVLLQSNLDEPCDPTLVDSQQLTAYQIAKANRHEICAKLIDDYQQSWTKVTPRTNTSGSINEQTINPVLIDPSKRFEDDQDERSENSSTSTTSRSSKQIKQSANQRPERIISSINVPKQETRSLADIIKNNPVQPDITKTNVSKPTNQTLTNLVNNNPLQPDAAFTTKPLICKFLLFFYHSSMFIVF
jgi:hypothetical protein